MFEWIDEQIYRLALSTKYAHLHSVFSVQLLEDYHCHHNNTELMIMSDLEDLQNEWDVKKVRNKWWIQSTIHYLIKWAGWSSEYNFYKPASHLAGALKVVTDYERKLKRKHKKISQINIDEALNSEGASHKQTSRWGHMLYSVHDVLNEALKSHVFHFITCFSFHML